jgi:hypothetical protein
MWSLTSSGGRARWRVPQEARTGIVIHIWSRIAAESRISDTGQAALRTEATGEFCAGSVSSVRTDPNENGGREGLPATHGQTPQPAKRLVGSSLRADLRSMVAAIGSCGTAHGHSASGTCAGACRPAATAATASLGSRQSLECATGMCRPLARSRGAAGRPASGTPTSGSRSAVRRLLARHGIRRVRRTPGERPRRIRGAGCSR